jgi:chemotaxis protein MotB
MRGRRNSGNGLDAWPGYVDALSTLLMVTIFVLLVFVLAEAFLSVALTGSDNTISQLKSQIAQLTESLSMQTAKTASLTQELAALNSQLAAAQSANAALSQQVAAAAGTQQKLAAQTQVSEAALNEIDLLNQQIAAMRMQLAMLAQALDAAQAADEKDNVQIADLGKQLNEALARKVEELQQYRSEFFGTLRQILANNKNIKVVGDRFVFQSDVLFPVGQATLTAAGQAEIADVATAVKQIATKIPPNVNWILSVDGYADAQPIAGGPYQTNFDLSAARALTVLHLLVKDGVPENRISAAALGSNNAITTGTTAADYAQNRRIEFRLTTP